VRVKARPATQRTRNAQNHHPVAAAWAINTSRSNWFSRLSPRSSPPSSTPNSGQQDQAQSNHTRPRQPPPKPEGSNHTTENADKNDTPDSILRHPKLHATAQPAHQIDHGQRSTEQPPATPHPRPKGHACMVDIAQYGNSHGNQHHRRCASARSELGWCHPPAHCATTAQKQQEPVMYSFGYLGVLSAQLGQQKAARELRLQWTQRQQVLRAR